MYKPDSENIQKANFQEENTWNIPKIKGIKKIDKNIEFIVLITQKHLRKRIKQNLVFISSLMITNSIEYGINQINT